MTFSDKYKKDNENIKPSEKTIMDLEEKMKSYNNNKMSTKNKVNYRLVATALAASLVLTVIILSKDKFPKEDAIVNNKNTISEGNNENIKTDDGYYIPKMQITENDSKVQACRIATLVYKGRVYTIGSANITLDEGKALMGEKLGETWDLSNHIEDNGTSAGYIDLEKLDDFATFGGGEEVYTVKGYDESFRLITYNNSEYGESISLWECLNDMALNNGNDLFGKMNIKDNLSSLKWDTFSNWNNGALSPKELTIDETVNTFIHAVYNSTPASLDSEELSEIFLQEGDDKQKFVYLKLEDGTPVELRLFSNGYVYYPGLNGFAFKVEDAAFNNMWEYLK